MRDQRLQRRLGWGIVEVSANNCVLKALSHPLVEYLHHFAGVQDERTLALLGAS